MVMMGLRRLLFVKNEKSTMALAMPMRTSIEAGSEVQVWNSETSGRIADLIDKKDKGRGRGRMEAEKIGWIRVMPRR